MYWRVIARQIEGGWEYQPVLMNGGVANPNKAPAHVAPERRPFARLDNRGHVRGLHVDCAERDVCVEFPGNIVRRSAKCCPAYYETYEFRRGTHVGQGRRRKVIFPDGHHGTLHYKDHWIVTTEKVTTTFQTMEQAIAYAKVFSGVVQAVVQCNDILEAKEYLRIFA